MIDDPKKRLPEKPRGLGRGLAALMGDAPSPAAAASGAAAEPRGALREYPIEQLMANPYQPRKSFDAEALATLAESIKQRGVLQPLVIRRAAGKPGLYEIIAGERRWRAAQLAKLHSIPAVLREIDDRQALEIGIIENVQREDLNAIEEALAYRRLNDEFAYTAEMIADAVGKSRSHVANTQRLLQLPEAVVRMITEGQITAGQARPLIGHPDAVQIAQRIQQGQLSARQAENLVKLSRVGAGNAGAGPRPRAPEASGGKPAASSAGSSGGPAARKDADTLAFERSVTQALGLKVEIDAEAGGEAGRLVIHYQTLEQLDDLAKKLSRR